MSLSKMNSSSAVEQEEQYIQDIKQEFENYMEDIDYGGNKKLIKFIKREDEDIGEYNIFYFINEIMIYN